MQIEVYYRDEDLSIIPLDILIADYEINCFNPLYWHWEKSNFQDYIRKTCKNREEVIEMIKKSETKWRIITLKEIEC